MKLREPRHPGKPRKPTESGKAKTARRARRPMKTLFFHMVSGPGLQFSSEKIGFEKTFFLRGFKTMVFYRVFEEGEEAQESFFRRSGPIRL